jgi:hypothetical protein
VSRLAFSQDPARLRLLISSDPPHADCVSLRLNDEGVDVLLEGHAPAVLAWEGYGHTDPEGWVLSGMWNQVSGNAPALGLHVTGRYENECGELFTARHWWLSGPARGRELTMVPRDTFWPPHADYDTLRALLDVLHARPELRSTLENPERMWQLAGDLTRGSLNDPAQHSGVMRETVDITATMRVLGYVHPFRRPIAGEPLQTLEHIVERVHARLDASPWREGRKANDADITRIVCEEYYDVRPWPFGALVR